MESKNLREAIISTVDEFEYDFSIYDITSVIREKCNNQELKIPECEVYSNPLFNYQIEHSDVKRIFYELISSGELDLNKENFNGKFNTYSNNKNKTIKARIINYLYNRSIDGKDNPTLKKIQSACKREFNNAKKVTVSDIYAILCDENYYFDNVDKALSKWTVIL